MRGLRTRVILLAAGAVIAGSGFAFMASNQIDQTGAGGGSGVVSGYLINHISYNDNTEGYACPNNGSICQVSFQAEASNGTEPPAANAYVAFDKNGTLITAWEVCSEVNGVQPGSNQSEPYSFTSWNCNFPGGVAPGPITSLHVRATS
ncbi:MAG TPA: hypothetical protein VNN74_06820 [Candidatus Micrarchaeia archaeon]|nr:hypothetical protein [Candidatus Micrarchaeia archaeon]